MAESESSTLEMLVIGAGPSGLAFAIELAQRWKETKKEKPTMIDLHITLRIEQSKEDGMPSSK